MAKLAEVTPPACSVCYQTRDDLRHVDFEVGYEGPVLPGDLPVQIDDLVICETCLAAGAKLVGLIDWAEAHETISQLREQLSGVEDALLERGRYVERLEAAVAAKPGTKRTPRQPTGAGNVAAQRAPVAVS